MFQLTGSIVGSPLIPYIVGFLRDTIYAAKIISECENCGFEDLGKLLIGGIALAVLVGIAASLLWRRSKEKDAGSSSFVSIKGQNRER